MGDRAHPGRQGELRKLKKRDENFPKAPGTSVRQIQRGDIDLVNVAKSVAGTVQLLQELFVAQAFFERLIGKAAVAGEEKPFPVGRNFR